MRNLARSRLKLKKAISLLDKGVELAKIAQDVYFQGLSSSDLTKAYCNVNNFTHSALDKCF